MNFRAFAPAKVILLGEHAAVYRHPAVGFALEEGVTANLTSGHGVVRISFHVQQEVEVDGSVNELIRSALGDLATSVDAEIDVFVPAAAGLGSSAAIAVAVIRAALAFEGRACDDAEIIARATKSEILVHGASSGLDPTLVTMGSLVRFRRTDGAPAIERVHPGADLHFVVACAGSHGGSKRSIQSIAELRTRSPKAANAALQTLGDIAGEGIEAIQRGDAETLGRLMDLANGVLSGFGVVSDGVDALLRAARERGALGAKMTGAGGRGGAWVALSTSRQAAIALSKDLEDLGARPTWVVSIPKKL